MEREHDSGIDNPFIQSGSSMCPGDTRVNSTVQVDSKGNVGKGQVYHLPTLGDYAKDGSRGKDAALQPPAPNGNKGAVEYRRGTCGGRQDVQRVACRCRVYSQHQGDAVLRGSMTLRIPTCHSLCKGRPIR